VRTPTSQRVTGTQIIYKATLDALHDSQRVFSAWISAVFAGVAILLCARGFARSSRFWLRRTREIGCASRRAQHLERCWRLSRVKDCRSPQRAWRSASRARS
jgi:hypothetical protein